MAPDGDVRDGEGEDDVEDDDEQCPTPEDVDVAPFEDVRTQLEANQGVTVFDDWFAEQLGTTNVEVNPRFGRFDHDTGLVLPIRSTAQEPAGGSSSTGSIGSTGSNAGS